MIVYNASELDEALQAIRSTIGKCEKVQPKLKDGTSQHTLLVRRIKAFQIAASLIERELENQEKATHESGRPIHEYQRLLQTTDLQKGYQEFVAFFRQLRTYLQKELPDFAFTGNIVENNMDYSYFQFTNDELKSAGLKIVIAFVHGDFEYQIWLSGVNREIQTKYQNGMKALRDSQHKQERQPVSFLESTAYPYPLVLTDQPTKTDYVISAKLVDDCDYSHLDELMAQMKTNTQLFAREVASLLRQGNRPQK